MPDPVDFTAGAIGTGSPQQIRTLQYALRSLGYLRSHIDGAYGDGTRAAVCALQHDLLTNDGQSTANDGAAPVAIRDYNRGRVAGVTGQVNTNLAACIAEMMQDTAFPKLPDTDDPVQANLDAFKTVAGLASKLVPIPFLLGIVLQESGGKHYREPGAGDDDRFVVVGLDRNNKDQPLAITSRGYGLGQFTLFHHPPTPDEVTGFISDPAENVTRAIRELRAKFDQFVTGPSSRADDRIQEAGTGPLRLCQYSQGDPRYMSACVQCLQDAGSMKITAGVTPVYAGTTDTYQQTQYHTGSYANVPVRKNIPCDWPYALRRYNGSGPNSYDYQAETLIKIAQLQQSSAMATGT